MSGAKGRREYYSRCERCLRQPATRRDDRWCVRRREDERACWEHVECVGERTVWQLAWALAVSGRQAQLISPRGVVFEVRMTGDTYLTGVTA